tara:strand:+ start:157 stop:909 length:753 start_codon:yes stop_codon:yes gene_type:complete
MKKCYVFFCAVFISLLSISNLSFARCDDAPGLADSHVLAMNWLSGFCETYGERAGKPECKLTHPDDFKANHMVLHGLWPNQKACGIRYGFCGVEKKRHFCAYDPLPLSDEVSLKLKQYMPSYKEGGCLERHEWYKHGVCQALTPDKYFSLAMRLNEAFNQSKAAQLITQHRGDKLSIDDFMHAFTTEYGQAAAGNVFLGCNNGQLVEIRLILPALIPEAYTLTELLNQTTKEPSRHGCPRTFEVSDFLKP